MGIIGLVELFDSLNNGFMSFLCVHIILINARS